MHTHELESTDNRIVTIDLREVVAVERDNVTFEVSVSGNSFGYFSLDQYELFMSAWKAKH